jgi:type I restriction enzyme S subunit
MNNNNTIYKDTPLGKIPVDWDVKTFASVCEKLLDGTHFSPKSKEGPYMYITSKNIRNDGLDLINKNYISEKDHKEIYKRCPVKLNDILLTKDGAGTGACCKNILTEEFSLLSSVAVLRVDKEKMNNEFLIHFIRSPLGQKIIQDEISGQAITRITLEKIKAFRIITPPLPEQKAIAHVLGLIDSVINTNNQLIAQKELQKKWLMQNLLTGKKRLKGFTEDLKEYHLGEMFLERNETRYFDLPLLSVGASGIYPQSDSIKKDTSNDDKSKYKRICRGDIGYNTMRMWQGRSALSSLDGIVSPAYTIVIPKENADSLFFAYLFKTPKLMNLFWRNSQGLVDDTLNCKFKDFSIVKIQLPEKKEQTAIAKVLQVTDKEITLLKVKTEKLREQKKGLMQVLLTGKKRLIINK